MTNRNVPVTEDELHALVDGELAPDRVRDVEAWLASHPEDAARVSAWRDQAEAIRLRYGGVAGEPVPARFDLDRLIASERPWSRFAAAAVVAALLLGGAGGWIGRGAWEGGPATKTVTADALDAHQLYVVEVRHPVEVPGAEEAHLVQWLSKRVGHEVVAPDLQALNLKLVGGRLLPGPKGAAAFFMYEGPSGERYTLYCARSAPAQTALHYRAAGKLGAVYWIDGTLTYVVSGPSDRERLQKVAESAYAQIDKDAARSSLPMKAAAR
jgi:anti-sigma factor RsiW